MRFAPVAWGVGPLDRLNDLVSIFDAPNDESASAYGLEVGMRGEVRTTTPRAYDREEISRIIQRLG